MADTRSKKTGAGIATLGKAAGRCLSCNAPLDDRRRRYCSVACRQRLRRALTLRTGLLRALNTRYATFYMTRSAVVLDVLPFDGVEISSFIGLRSSRRTPADDFSRMADLLGKAWWAERRRTNRKYLASRFVLNQAARRAPSSGEIVPMVITNPAVRGASLIHLKLTREALETTDLQAVIKGAYRTQAKIHHPDMGGDAAGFLKIRTAYETLMQWAEEPTFTRRRGFPDKWFYDGRTNRWVQPTPIPKT